MTAKLTEVQEDQLLILLGLGPVTHPGAIRTLKQQGLIEQVAAEEQVGSAVWVLTDEGRQLATELQATRRAEAVPAESEQPAADAEAAAE